MTKAIQNHKISGDGEFTKKCNKWIEDKTGTAKALLTTSCTHATEMAALLADIKPGDEVIMPSFTFVSTADAFVLRGATAVFVDIRPDTMNIDETLIEDAITDKTRAIVPVHYAGVSCEMDTIMAGLACGEPSTVSWGVLRDYSSSAISCPDYLAANGMRILAAPRPGDSPIVSGESGAVTCGLLEYMSRPQGQALRKTLGLGPDSTVLIVSTEGDTSPEIYEQIVWHGHHPDGGN